MGEDGMRIENYPGKHRTIDHAGCSKCQIVAVCKIFGCEDFFVIKSHFFHFLTVFVVSWGKLYLNFPAKNLYCTSSRHCFSTSARPKEHINGILLKTCCNCHSHISIGDQSYTGTCFPYFLNKFFMPGTVKKRNSDFLNIFLKSFGNFFNIYFYRSFKIYYICCLRAHCNFFHVCVWSTQQTSFWASSNNRNCVVSSIRHAISTF